MRRAAPLFRTVVPAITQIPGTFGDVSYATKGTIQPQSSWEDTVDHQVISTGINYEEESYTTTTTTTTTVTSPTLYNHDLSAVSYSAEDITPRLNDVYDGLSIGFNEHSASFALVQVVKDTTSDPAILNKIMKLDSFQKFVNTLPSVKSRSQISATQREIASPVGAYSTGTQTEYLDFLEEIDESLQEITSQIIPPVSSVTTITTTTSTSSSPSIPISSVDNTNSNSIPATSSFSSSSSSASASTSNINNTQETSDFTEGSAGVPGNTEERSLATKVILPLAILAVAACVALPNAASAINLLKSGIRFLSKILTSQPAF